MDNRAVAMVLAQQDQVISRSQLIACGGGDNDIARKLRRREWAQQLPGVYVAHTGPLTRAQQEWVAVLHYAPAALTGRTALRRYGLRVGREAHVADLPSTIHIAVGRERRVNARAGIKVTRTKRFESDVLQNLTPPRVRLEHAVLDLASATSDELSAVAVLCDAVQARRTTPGRLLDALEGRPRLRHRALLRRILADVEAGAYSVLEREYLNRVERRHSMPSGSRQRRGSNGSLAGVPRRRIRVDRNHRRARRTTGPRDGARCLG